jgi:hypothetical protein
MSGTKMSKESAAAAIAGWSGVWIDAILTSQEQQEIAIVKARRVVNATNDITAADLLAEAIRTLKAIDHPAVAIVRMLTTQSRPCQRCGSMIHFVRLPSGAKHPFDGNGESHFATCPYSAAFRTKRREAVEPPHTRRLFDEDEDNTRKNPPYPD